MNCNNDCATLRHLSFLDCDSLERASRQICSSSIRRRTLDEAIIVFSNTAFRDYLSSISAHIFTCLRCRTGQ